MTKLCSVCGTENRDEAQFCRSCGTAFPPAAASGDEEAQLAAGITCDECNFQNKPGVRYCANCGVSLLGTVIVPRSRSGAASPDAHAVESPPPISYPSFAPVAPYPSPPLASPSYPPVAGGYASSQPPGYPPPYDDPMASPDLPDPAAAITATNRYADDDDAPTVPAPVMAPAAKAPNRTPLILGLALVALVAAGAGGWWFMNSSGGAKTEARSASAPMAAPAPIDVEPPAPVVAAPAPIPAASAPEVSVAPPEVAASPVQPTLPPPTAVAMPPVVEPPASTPAVDAEALRIAADKRREKAARDKADREAKARTLAEQQQQAAAAARLEQEAARRRAEEAQRARPVQVAPPPAPVTAQVRGVREICAGRGAIAESICRSRECGAPEHVNEAVCKQQKEIEDRHRN